MTFTIPMWIIILLGIPIAMFVLLCALLGFLFIKNFKGLKW